MDYIGSKTKLVGWIAGHIQRQVARLGMTPRKTCFLDACAGSGTVAAHMATQGFRVEAVDLMAFSQHMVRGKVGFPSTKFNVAHELMQKINEAPGVQGLFWKHYSPAGDRMFFTEDNARRIDTARQCILEVTDPEVQSYLFYCGLETLSRVANTAGTHGAYMKQWKDRAKGLFMLLPQTSQWCPEVHAQQGDATALVGTLGEDVLYLDPPYTTRQYGPNYHLYDTFVLPRFPVVKGKTGLPDDIARSDFCKTEMDVAGLVHRLLRQTTARLMFISYSSDGTVGLDQMMTSLMGGAQQSSIEVQVREYPRYRSAEQDTSKKLSDTPLREYLFIIERTEPNVWDLLSEWSQL